MRANSRCWVHSRLAFSCAVGEDDDELVGVVAAVALGAVEEQPDGVVQRRHAARFEATGDRADGVERRRVDEHVVRVVVVELDDRDGRLAAGRPAGWRRSRRTR